MNKHTVKTLALTVVFVWLSSGCATTRNLIEAGDYQKEIVPSRRTYFKQVRAVNDDGELRVSGKLRLKGGTRANAPDFVEVTLIDRDGAVLDSKKTPYFPGSLTGRKGRFEARFSARFTQVPPPGAVIRLSNVN